jgi:hypothetical protein
MKRGCDICQSTTRVVVVNKGGQVLLLCLKHYREYKRKQAEGK